MLPRLRTLTFAAAALAGVYVLGVAAVFVWTNEREMRRRLARPASLRSWQI